MQCNHCGLIQVAHKDRLSPAAEKSIYDLHQNDPLQPEYRQFLQRLVVPLLTHLPSGARGLDFGCGPGPALASLLSELGYTCHNYDLYYAHEPALLQRPYNFITATEVFEHLAEPAEVLGMLTRCLVPGGVLAIMMQRPDEQPDFAKWGYLKDPTHITFYTNQSLEFIQQRFNLNEVYRDRDVLIFALTG